MNVVLGTIRAAAALAIVLACSCEVRSQARDWQGNPLPQSAPDYRLFKNPLPPAARTERPVDLDYYKYQDRSNDIYPGERFTNQPINRPANRRDRDQ
jgi:hypothetical protein